MKKKQTSPRLQKPEKVKNNPSASLTLQRRGFLKTLGLAGGTVILGKSAWAAGTDNMGSPEETDFKPKSGDTVRADQVGASVLSPVKTGVILVNHVGFPPNAAKYCVIPSPPEKEFTIHQLKDTKWTQVFAGVLTEGGSELEPGWVGDFSALKEDGIYQVRCSSLKSRAFTVYAGVYDVPMRSLFNYFTWARCGDTTKNCIGPCHLDDGNLMGVGHRDFSGGYHQSSDLRKLHWGLNLGLMGLVEFGGLQKPHWDNGSIAEEVRWGCDYYQKIVRDDGGMFDSVFIPLGWGPRDYYNSDPPAPALWNNIRHQAMASEYFKDRDKVYAAKCRQTAEHVWRYMTSDKRPKGKYVATAVPPLGNWANSEQYAAFYEGSAQDLAHRIGAATILQRVTHDAALLEDAARCASQLMALQLADSACFWEGPEGDQLATRHESLWPYYADGTIGIRLAELIVAAPQHKDAKRWCATIKRMADQMVALSRRNAWALTPSEFLVQDAPADPAKTKATNPEGRYPLGSLKDRAIGPKERIIAYKYRPFLYHMNITDTALFLNRAAEITGDKIYRTVAQRQLDWVMGCNPFDASAIEGVGYNQPLRGLYGEFFPPTPQIPGAVSVGLNAGSFSPEKYGNGPNEYDMPVVGNVLWLIAEQAKGNR